ncbi:MAG: choice-of-anchor D domain-containing protein [Pseudomonadota bacterium]|nr:choice-of-anchor D domain-containing protein [Pseudomonadota bacterium]
MNHMIRRMLGTWVAALLALATPCMVQAAVTSVTVQSGGTASPVSGASVTLHVLWTAPDNQQGPMTAFLCSDIDQPDPPSRFVPNVSCAPDGIGTPADAHIGPANVTYNSAPGVSPFIDIIDNETASTVQRALQVAIARNQPLGTRHFYLIQQFASGWAVYKYTIQETTTGTPAVQLSNNALNFGNVQVQSTGGPLQFTLTNSGNAALNVTNVQVPAPFAVTNTCGTSVPAGGSCIFNVTFTPTTTGPAQQTLLITTNATGSPHQVTLQGTGIAIPVAGPSLAPSSLNFQNQQIQTPSSPQLITLANVGTAPLNNVVISITGAAQSDFAVQQLTCGTSLAPNSSCGIVIRFTPSAIGARTASLVVTTANGTVTAPLAGTGTVAPVVNPSGLISSVSPLTRSVNTDRPSSFPVTYRFAQNTTAAQAVNAFFCTTLSSPVPSNGVTGTNPCSPGDIIAPYNPDRTQGATPFTTVRNGVFLQTSTETVAVPGPVSRFVYLRARENGALPVFYFVRQFSPTAFAVVTLQLSGNMANQPVSMTDVRVAFRKGNAELPLTFVRRNETPPAIEATLYYTGSGILRGRWEVVAPGDFEPTVEDLIPEASLPFAARGSQRRYQLVERFQAYLPATGRFVLPGPDVSKLPVRADGQYRVLLRFEAEPAIGSDEPLFLSGGSAPFPLPTLRYFVGSIGGIPGGGTVQAVVLDRPMNGQTIPANQLPQFRWRDVVGASVYRVEIQQEDGDVLLSALVRAGVGTYRAPPFIRERAKSEIQRWRVTAVDVDGTLVGQSAWREVRVQK